METDRKIRVGVLRGGAWDSYQESLDHGGDLLNMIAEHLNDKYKIVDILVDKDGIWHIGGLPIFPMDLSSKVDMVWNASHPSFGSVLKSLSMPHVSQDAFLVGLENNPDLLKDHAKNMGFQIPRSILFPAYQEDIDGNRADYSIRAAKKVHEKFGAPWVVKAHPSNPDMGIHVARTFGDLVSAIDDGVNHAGSILVQELIVGKEASVHTVPNFRSHVPGMNNLYTFPVLPNEHSTLKFSNTEREKLMEIARKVHKELGARHYLQSDLIITPSGRVYLVGIESTPDLEKGSHFEHSCESVGAKMHQVIEHILERALFS